MSAAYPDEPWRLAGEAFVSVWSVPRRALPRVPDVVSPLMIGGRAVVVTAWIDYTPPGQLSYHELLATVATRPERRFRSALAASITEIWVDTALGLGEKSLRTMERLVRAQVRRGTPADALTHAM